MVRILKVNELREKKSELLARSEIHRQTLTLEITNVKLGLSLIKKRMRVLKTLYRFLGFAVPIGGLLFGHKQQERKRGFLSKLMSGFNLATRIRSLFGGGKAAHNAPEEAEESARF
jgi:hypothetical protein